MNLLQFMLIYLFIVVTIPFIIFIPEIVNKLNNFINKLINNLKDKRNKKLQKINTEKMKTKKILNEMDQYGI